MFVDPYEIAQGHGKVSLLGGGKRIKTQRIFQTRHQNCKAERIEADIQQDKQSDSGGSATFCSFATPSSSFITVNLVDMGQPF
jgi:hypothetical protein